jgi:hypothetical protein
MFFSQIIHNSSSCSNSLFIMFSKLRTLPWSSLMLMHLLNCLQLSGGWNRGTSRRGIVNWRRSGADMCAKARLYRDSFPGFGRGHRHKVIKIAQFADIQTNGPTVSLLCLKTDQENLITINR